MSKPDKSIRDEMKDFAFRYLDGGTIMKSDDLTVVIRGHLLVEAFLERLLKQRMDLSVFDARDDLTFSRKLKMAHALGLLGGLYPPIKQLNKIRNIFAHDIQTKLQDIDISIFIKFYEKNWHGNDPEWAVTMEDKKTRLGIVIHYILGCLAGIVEATEVPT